VVVVEVLVVDDVVVLPLGFGRDVVVVDPSPGRVVVVEPLPGRVVVVAPGRVVVVDDVVVDDDVVVAVWAMAGAGRARRVASARDAPATRREEGTCNGEAFRREDLLRTAVRLAGRRHRIVM
jgi:hypothetical protein